MPDSAHEPLYKCAVLGLNGGPTDDLVVRVGCELARGRKMDLIALHVIEVDWRHDLADDLSSNNEAASAVLDRAEGVAERQRMALRTQLLQARDIGAALVDEAAELGADVLVIGLPYRQRFGGDFAIGEVIPYVFANATCSVLVVREPVTVDERRAEPAAISYDGR